MMTTLTMTSYTLPAAKLGPENALPAFRVDPPDMPYKLDPSIPLDEQAYIGKSTGFRVLPYRIQDGYDRDKQMTSFQAAVLENEILRAIFLPQFGGRLVSLVDKRHDRELLARNPVFQPANLALRNAWFSGGVEWNPSQLGHHYHTCDPVFAARVVDAQGQPVLRIYEWDRVKCFPWQIDFHLPSGSPFLFAKVRLINPHDHVLPTYWWTNIAVPESSDSRILVPADSAITSTGDRAMDRTAIPQFEGMDVSYPTRLPYSREFFFRLEGRRPWIASLDGQGSGLIHTSTHRLKGRKMFVWGMNAGGRRWQEYLGSPGHAYVEIQAGLAQTQPESLPMPPQAQWSWTEAFGLLSIDPSQAHSMDWSAAWHAVDAELTRQLSAEQLDRNDQTFTEVLKHISEEEMSRGAGWGALERRRLASQHRPDRVPSELRFDGRSLGPEQQPWLTLLETGTFPSVAVTEDPGLWMIQPEWEELLRSSVLSGSGKDNWQAWLHLGVMRLEAYDGAGARQAWERSLACRRSAWALRNLAVLETREQRWERARELLAEAWEIGPRIAPLAVEYVQVLLASKHFPEIPQFIAALPVEIRNHERLTILDLRAKLEANDLANIDERVFAREFATIREGEVALTDLWFDLQARRYALDHGVPLTDEPRKQIRKQCIPPRTIDFRAVGE